METDAPETHASGVLKGRFRRSRQIDDHAGRVRLVQLAISKAKQGDQEALRYVYIQYADNVYGYVLSLLRDEHDAEDVTQQVFAKLMTILPKYEQRDVPFSAWILRVARNLAVDHMRQRRAMLCAEPRNPDTQLGDPRHDEALSVRQALAELPSEQREVVFLRHIIGLSPGEIAEQIGKSESSVHGLHHRGRRALRSALADLELAPATAA